MQSFASRAGRWSLALTLVAVAAITIGCVQPSRYAGPPGRPSSPSSVASRSWASGTSHTITAAEFTAVAANTAYDLVLRLRPELFHSRGRRGATSGASEPVVYINDREAGPLSTLSLIPSDVVSEIRYLEHVDAFMRYGASNAGGVIVVYVKR